MFDWPAATVILGTLATVVVGIMKWSPARTEVNGRFYAKATEMSEVCARLTALERAQDTLREDMHKGLEGVQNAIIGLNRGT